MSSTNKTANYNLTQFIGSDKPAWLVDYNGDMAAIDTQMKVNADAAAAAQSTANGADGKADTNASAISALNTQINGASGIADDLSSVQGAVNTINSLIGNGEPTTTDKTIIGAINEIAADLSGVESTVEKLDNCYVTNETNTIFASVAFDGVKTRAQILAELRNAFLTYLSNLPATKKVKISTIKCGSWVKPVFDTFYDRNTVSTVQLEGSAFGFSPSGNNQVISMAIPSDSANILFKVAELSASGTAVTDKSSEVGASGYATIEGVVYEQV